MARQPLPERPRRYRFALTPLADAMFQLLIFFMLSTSLTPYSLLTIKTAPASAAEESEAVAQGAGTEPVTSSASGPDVTIWTVENASVRVAGQAYALDQLGDLADAIGSQSVPGNVVILVTSEARVQDVASALEALEGANVGAVQITREGA